jgi:dUTP pyrophosphatase
LKIKKIFPDVILPKYNKKNDAGFDLCAYTKEDIYINSGESKIIQTGLFMEIPDGHFGSIRDRSGLAAKNSLHVLAGVVDSNFRGHVQVILINLGTKQFIVQSGNRIAQMIIQPIVNPEIQEVSELSDSERGSDGFGSTGIK